MRFALSLKICWTAFVLLFCGSFAQAQLKITPREASGVYAESGTVGWTVTRSNPADSTNYQFRLLLNGITPLKEGRLRFAGDKASIDCMIDQPGALLMEIQPESAMASSNPGKTRILSGALIDPQSIHPTLPRPADFDEWWAKKIEQLQAVPMNAVLEAGTPERRDVDFYKVQFDNIGSRHIHGQLAKPSRGHKFPALLILQWAGIYSLPQYRVEERAVQGWLTLNIEPHDIEIDRAAAYYKQLADGPLKDYYRQGNNDRERSYFLAMYLSAYRAVDYLTSRPDWDGQTLVVMGTSMGGQQSFPTAALNHKVTAMMVLVPSGCDTGAPTNTLPRAGGFPDWANQAKQMKSPAILETSCYFDPANFASRIHCPALVSMGLYDETSPPANVYSALNQLAGKKESLPIYSGHSDAYGSQKPYNARVQQWLDAILKHESLPPP